ncbi:MAG: NAD(P)/FAD-dependent oxidoreductase, partial [Coriobacteriales bacterium]|nr:NAD(P)/FAD-dependent oxidoreductase [Coriobacteriales bacterium]
IKGTHEKIKDHIDWLVRQCESAGVTMNLNTEVTADTVAADAPDVMIAATGGIRALPSIPGVDNPVVASGYIPEDDADTIVVVGGLECEGVQVAAYLAKQGKQVTLIDELPEDRFGWIMPDWIGPTQKYYCQTHGVRILAGVKYGSITDDGITVTLSHDNIEETIECDNIVLALPVSPDSSLLDEIKDSVTETYAIGDCNEHGLIREAVLSGNLLARKL